MYYKSAGAVALVYDQTCRESFDSLIDWVKEIEEHRTGPVLVVVVANKCDCSEKE